MSYVGIFTIVVIIILAASLAYKSAFFHNKKIGYISLLQVLYLVVVPGVIFTIMFSFIIDILERPLNHTTLLNDKLIISILLLSTLYTYGGIAIHSISKTVASYFKNKQNKSLAYEVNKYFHHEFSHNLAYSGAVVVAICFAMLELNHVSPYPEQIKLLIPVFNGVIIGFSLIASLLWYKKQRWLELKLVFLSFWIVFVIFLFSIKPHIKNVQSYPITLSMLIASIFMAVLSGILYVRRFKNKIKFVLKIPKKLFD